MLKFVFNSVDVVGATQFQVVVTGYELRLSEVSEVSLRLGLTSSKCGKNQQDRQQTLRKGGHDEPSIHRLSMTGYGRYW